ncbi:MAG: class I SAM-dependent methyltransferase [Bryobacteraceae bacterium]
MPLWRDPHFVEIPPDVLKEYATESIRMPKLYYHPSILARKFFWLRLRYLSHYMQKYANQKKECLDFGCGSGIFLPTLTKLFPAVTGIDIETKEAYQIVDRYHLPVRLVNADIYKENLPSKSFDVISAADVLEHFSDLGPPVSKIREWLKDDGLLFTSLPTENAFTRACRVVGSYEKPWDHYHTGYQVEAFIRKMGFRAIRSATVIPIFPLYLVSVWQKTANP